MRDRELREHRHRGRSVVTALALAAMVMFPVMAGAQGTPHTSCEADEGHPCCVIRIPVDLPGGEIISFAEIGRTFPEWEGVERGDGDYQAGLSSNTVLEGTVAIAGGNDDVQTGPHVSFEDTPFGHDTHDFCFKVLPDDSYRYLLGEKVTKSGGATCSVNAAETCTPECPLEPPPDGFCPAPCIVNSNGDCVDLGAGGACLVCPSDCEELSDGRCTKTPGGASCNNLSCEALQGMADCASTVTTQDDVEVEWEVGVGADNDSNPCHSANESGNSCGYFSQGHTRRELIWQWPTAGDHVHVEGFWIFDRGHAPASTEIHPPRLVAIQRQLPSMFGPSVSTSNFVVATKTDVFASGDGNALNNNRSGAPSFVRRVPMGEKDYTFKITHNVPPPGPTARLNAAFVLHDGDTFPANPLISQDSETLPNGSVHFLPSMTVTIPWNSQAAPDTAVFARTFYVWWSTGDNTADLTVNHGVQADYHPRIFKVTPDYVLMDPGANDMLEPGTGQGDMELRVFVEVAGNWLFLNELASDDVGNILEDGLGDADDHTEDGVVIDRRGGGLNPWQFTLVLPPGGKFRIHTDGWEADGINEVFGNLIDPNVACDCSFQDQFNNLFGLGTYLSGGRDDPIGEVNHLFSCENADAELGSTHATFVREQAGGGIWSDDITGDTVNQNGVYQFQFNIQELAWHGTSGTVLPGGPCDTFPPDITINQPTATQYVHSATLTLDYSAVDVGGAGLKDLGALMDNAATLAGHGLASGQKIRLLTEMRLGPHTFTVNADDYLGNAGSKSVTFEIIVTPESIKIDVIQFVADGSIDPLSENSLLQKLINAAKSRSKGNCASASFIYGAFINEVQAQSGKNIDPAAAQILIEDAQYLMTHCLTKAVNTQITLGGRRN
ncbi:MAG: hypothetical protein LAO51_00355 [Acidobacteriia bacterium]|nr:hypothetical protein [Terriglobia bacterium]